MRAVAGSCLLSLLSLANAFTPVPPSRWATRPSALTSRRSTPHATLPALRSRMSLRTTAGRLFMPPPIAPRPLNVTRAQVLSPRFVAEEMVLGARTMVAFHPTLMLCSSVARPLWAMAAQCLPAQVATPAFLIAASPFHALEHFFKRAVNDGFIMRLVEPHVSTPLIIHVFVGPVAEELAYRGTAQWLIRFFFAIQIRIARFFGRRGRFTSGVYVAYRLCTLSQVLVFGCRSSRIRATAFLGGFAAPPSPPVVVGAAAVLLVLVPFAFSLASAVAALCVAAAAARRARPGDGNVGDRAAVKHLCDVETSASFVGGILSRSYGAAFFGLAHLGQATTAEGLAVSAQKCVGTAASSLLIESRLAHSRRNVWAACGAHIAFNALAHCPTTIALQSLHFGPSWLGIWCVHTSLWYRFSSGFYPFLALSILMCTCAFWLRALSLAL